jgi:hypothetical protein
VRGHKPYLHILDNRGMDTNTAFDSRLCLTHRPVYSRLPLPNVRSRASSSHNNYAACIDYVISPPPSALLLLSSSVSFHPLHPLHPPFFPASSVFIVSPVPTAVRPHPRSGPVWSPSRLFSPDCGASFHRLFPLPVSLHPIAPNHPTCILCCTNHAPRLAPQLPPNSLSTQPMLSPVPQ